MQLAVLNPGGRDAMQDFPDGPGAPDVRVHPPVNYHAYAACTRGGFFSEARAIPATMRAVLVLLRKKLPPALAAVKALKAEGRSVAISWKESGLHQVAEQLDSVENLAMFREICSLADAALSSTPELVPLYRAAGAKAAEFIPTPYPVDDARWDFSWPLAERAGIFIGTREWDVPSRNHAAALLRASVLGVPVTVCNFDGRAGRRKLDAIFPDRPPHEIGERLDYPDYLREMAKCRVVFQLDSSAVPGQVAGDALLCRMPCIGGNGAVDRAVFAEDNLEELLRDDAAWRTAVDASQRRAAERLSFATGAGRLRAFFAGFGG